MAPARRLWTEASRLTEALRNYWTGKKIEEPPAISARTAFLCAVLFTIFYVAPFYISPTLRASPLTSRDSPTVIRSRVRAVAWSCIASTAITIFIFVHYGHATTADVLRLLGIWPIDPLDIVKALGLTALLFVGPLFETLFVLEGWRDLAPSTIKEMVFDSWTGYRNIIVAPISEEWVFRSLVIALYLLAKVAPARIVFTTPLIFGLAHIHHFVEFVQNHLSSGRSGPVSRIVLLGLVRSLFQLTYTSLFGFFAAFVFLRTGSIVAAIAVHSFCNTMGFPRLWGRVGHDNDLHTATPDIAQGKRDDNLEAQTRGNGVSGEKKAFSASESFSSKSARLTVIYYLLLIVGAYGFYRLLWPLTESRNALATFWEFV